MSSFENVEIFEDTKRLCETNGKIKDALARSVNNQKLIPEGTELSVVDKARFTDEAKIVVSTKRTFEAAAGYAGQTSCSDSCMGRKHGTLWKKLTDMKLPCLGNKRKTHSACLRNKRKETGCKIDDLLIVDMPVKGRKTA